MILWVLVWSLAAVSQGQRVLFYNDSTCLHGLPSQQCVTANSCSNGNASVSICAFDIKGMCLWCDPTTYPVGVCTPFPSTTNYFTVTCPPTPAPPPAWGIPVAASCSSIGAVVLLIVFACWCSGKGRCCEDERRARRRTPCGDVCCSCTCRCDAGCSYYDDVEKGQSGAACLAAATPSPSERVEITFSDCRVCRATPGKSVTRIFPVTVTAPCDNCSGTGRGVLKRTTENTTQTGVTDRAEKVTVHKCEQCDGTKFRTVVVEPERDEVSPCPTCRGQYRNAVRKERPVSQRTYGTAAVVKGGALNACDSTPLAKLSFKSYICASAPPVTAG